MRTRVLTYYLEKKNIRSVVSYCVLAFLYLYPLKFSFFPYLNTRYLLGCVGLLYLCRHRRQIRMSTDFKKGIVFLFLHSLIVCLSCVINLTTDLSLFLLPLTFFFNFLAFWGCFSLQGKPDAEKFSFYLIVACLLQVAIALLFYFNPEVENMVGSFFYSSKMGQDALDRTAGIRLHGLGSNFFSAGVDNSIILILISIFVNQRKRFYIICFVLITIIGTCIARTTLVGFILALPILLYNVSKRSLSQSFSMVLIIVAIMLFVINYAKNHDDIEVRKLYYFGAEFIENYEKTGSISTESSSNFYSISDRINSMSLMTFLIGDGLFADPKDPEMAYYMHVDQGYLRIIYYIGIIGLMVKLITYFYLSRDNVKRMGSVYFYLFFVLYLIILYKGDINIFYFLIPYCFLSLKCYNNGQKFKK